MIPQRPPTCVLCRQQCGGNERFSLTAHSSTRVLYDKHVTRCHEQRRWCRYQLSLLVVSLASDFFGRTTLMYCGSHLSLDRKQPRIQQTSRAVLLFDKMVEMVPTGETLEKLTSYRVQVQVIDRVLCCGSPFCSKHKTQEKLQVYKLPCSTIIKCCQGAHQTPWYIPQEKS